MELSMHEASLRIQIHPRSFFMLSTPVNLWQQVSDKKNARGKPQAFFNVI
jgi:hypothetical protein